MELMNDESWKIQYKHWKILKPYQIKLIDEGPKPIPGLAPKLNVM